MSSNKKNQIEKENQFYSIEQLRAYVPKDLQDKFQIEGDLLNFDYLQYEKTILNQGLVYYLIYLFCQNNLLEDLKIQPQVFFNLINIINEGYSQENSFHNSLHAFDCLQMVHYILISCGVKEMCQLNSLDLAILYLAAATHDFKHRGVNNQYLITTKSDLSYQFNDQSIQENHSIQQFFELTLKQPYNIFSEWTDEEYFYFRNIFIKSILYTDLKRQTELTQEIVKIIDQGHFDPVVKDKSTIMQAILQLGDLAHQFRPYGLFQYWVTKVYEELWKQGDSEREQKRVISYLCDRNSMTRFKIVQSQINYNLYIVKPFIVMCKQIIQELQPLLDEMFQNQLNLEQEFKQLQEQENQRIQEQEQIENELKKVRINETKQIENQNQIKNEQSSDNELQSQNIEN